MQAAVVRMLRGAGECPERDGLRGTGALACLRHALAHALLRCRV
jgi:hypothetical protein